MINNKSNVCFLYSKMLIFDLKTQIRTGKSHLKSKKKNMKNMLTLIVLLSSWLTVYSQESYTEAELKQKCDSIVEEANTLYRYETAAWNFTDMTLPNRGLIETIRIF